MNELKKICFYNDSNIKLKGIYIKSKKTPSPCVIVCHGFTGTKEGGGKSIEMANYFAKQGMDILLFDFSGNGESGGKFEDITLTSQIRDLASAVSWIRSRGHKKIFIMGRSFGGTTAICYQSTYRENICGIMAINSVSNPYSLFQKFIHKKTKNRVILKSQNGEVIVKETFFDDLKTWNIPLCSSRVSPCPLLIIHGQQDELVPVKQGYELYANAHEPKKLEIIPNLDHRMSTSYKKVWDTALYWITGSML